MKTWWSLLIFLLSLNGYGQDKKPNTLMLGANLNLGHSATDKPYIDDVWHYESVYLGYDLGGAELMLGVLLFNIPEESEANRIQRYDEHQYLGYSLGARFHLNSGIEDGNFYFQTLLGGFGPFRREGSNGGSSMYNRNNSTSEVMVRKGFVNSLGVGYRHYLRDRVTFNCAFNFSYPGVSADLGIAYNLLNR